jgi:hypothetical protein
VVPLNADIARLSDSKRKALAQYIEGSFRSQAVQHRISPRPSSVLAPLSLAQEQLWRRTQVAATPLLYNESITLHRKGPLDIALLERSITEIIRRHEIWRTTYEISDGQPRQVVHSPRSTFPLGFVDLRTVTAGQREASAVRLATEDARRPFELEVGPLLRAMVIRMGDEDSRLSLTAHLSIVDGVSVYQVFPYELTRVYEAFSACLPSPLPELTIQYGDYAYWQREWLTNHEIPRQLEYWRKRLGGELPTLSWPSGHRPPVQTFRGAIRSFTFPAEILAAIKELCRREGASMFIVLQAGFTALLHRYTRQKEILVGTFSPAGRKRSEVQGLLGHFLNPVPLRIDLSGDPSFSELLRQSQCVTYDAISHDDVPLELLARELLPTRDESRNPFFTVGMSLQPPVSGICSGWSVTSMDAESGGAFWDLYLVFIERSDELAGRVQYNPDLFDAATIAQMVSDLQALLAAAVRNPEQRVSQLQSHM